MVTKKELITMLEECMKVEESVVPIYSKHINNTLFLSGFSQDIQKQITAILDTLRQESERHKNILEQLLMRVKEEDKDVY